jgi:predicted dehydrogenase
MGGTEAVAVLRFRMAACEGTVRFSWLSRYENTFEVIGDGGSVSGGLFDWNTVNFKSGAGRRTKLRLPSSAKIPQDLGNNMLDNFIDVIRGQAAALVSGADVLPSIELLDDCYSSRKRMAAPWYDAWRRVAS